MLDAIILAAAFNVSPALEWCLPKRDLVMETIRAEVGRMERIVQTPDATEVYLAPGWVAVVYQDGRVWCVHAERTDRERR